MALYDNPPHRCDVYAPTSSRDGGGGTRVDYTLAASGVPCSFRTDRSTTRNEFGQEQLTMTGQVAFLTSTPGVSAIVRGGKLVNPDTGEVGHVAGIAADQAYGTIPPLTYVTLEGFQA
jgi:hypothetical protein